MCYCSVADPIHFFPIRICGSSLKNSDLDPDPGDTKSPDPTESGSERLIAITFVMIYMQKKKVGRKNGNSNEENSKKLICKEFLYNPYLWSVFDD